jgi:16S rRNA (cytidine1402-2'-O)-methyltransferase
VVKEADTNPPASGKKGMLFLVPAPLDFGCREQAPLQQQLPLSTLQTAARIQHWICENAKSLRAYLGRVQAVCALSAPVQSLQITELPREAHKKGDHTGGFDATPLLAAAVAGHDMALVSEAGMPAIADPGSSVVRAAHGLGMEVVALVGPVSLMLALAASGLNGQSFAFVGYLPSDPAGRAQRVRELEALARKTGQAQLFIETPYRNAAMLQTLVQTLAPITRLSVSSALTTPQARTISQTVARWRTQGAGGPDNTTPAVFGIGP